MESRQISENVFEIGKATFDLESGNPPKAGIAAHEITRCLACKEPAMRVARIAHTPQFAERSMHAELLEYIRNTDVAACHECTDDEIQRMFLRKSDRLISVADAADGIIYLHKHDYRNLKDAGVIAQ